MKFKMPAMLKKDGKLNTKVALIFALSFALVGGLIILITRAAGSSAVFEAESGTLSSPASVVSDTTASGGKYLQFGTGGTTTTPPPSAGTVDATTLDHKFMLGYQGWHQCPNDGSTSSAWRHWFNGTPPTNPLVDYWPDVSELTAAERCDTGLKLPNGQPAYLFSDYNAATVNRHFQWMQQNGIDGVMLQRFTSELSISYMFAERNKVTSNVQAGAEANGRTFNIMYDITGTPASSLVSTIENDWKYMVDNQKATASARYLHQGGKPVVVLWGFGFSDRPGTPADLQTLLNFFHNNANPAYDAYVMGGVNNDWRTNSTWASALTGFDAISPWMVGRVNSLASADSYKTTTAAELAYAKSHNQMYMPVVFPGFSFHNQNSSQPLNQIPRLGGNFLWRQAYNDVSTGATTMYGAMFDEVNEGTAFFKQANSSAMWPTGLNMVSLNADGNTNIPTDWYLRLAGEITKMVKGQIAPTSTIPISPTASSGQPLYRSVAGKIHKTLFGAHVAVSDAWHNSTQTIGHVLGAFSGRQSVAAAGDPVLVAAGDIACDPGANTGSPNNCDQGNVANLIKTIAPQAILTLGDNQYESNTSAAYSSVYDPSYGAASRALGIPIHPAIGNHEYLTTNATGYFGYFGAAAGPADKGYYSYNIGGWHFLSLNSECSHIGGCAAGSGEDTFVKNDLAANKVACTVAYYHEPRFSSGQHGDAQQMATIWNDMVAGGVDIVLSGHNHDYERFQKAGNTAAGSATQAPNLDPNGIMEFVVGTGGKNHYGFGTQPMLAGEVVRDSTTYGVLKLTLHAGSYDWQFANEPLSGKFTDSGSSTCSGGSTTPPPPPPSDTTAPTASITAPANGSQVSGTVAINANASDNVGVTKVDFLVDGAVKSTDTTSPYSYSWSTAGLTGTHVITVKATDAAGNVGTSAAVSVTIATSGGTTCTAPSTPGGISTVTVNAPVAGTYHVWSRMKAASTTANSYVFNTNGTCNMGIGGTSAVSTSAWTWVNFQPGTTVKATDITLTAGSHTIQLYGTQTGVKVDRVMLLSDTCVPTGTGDNCLAVTDTTPPAVNITSPLNNATVSGKVNVTATASDTGGSGLTKVDFLVDNSLVATSTTSPYGFSWDTSGWTVGSHKLTAIASDGANNSTTSTAITVNIQSVTNTTDTTPPTAPTNLSATVAGATQVNLSWTASTDNVAVAGYYVERNGVTLNQIDTATNYSDAGLAANTKYTYQVMAADTSGNLSPLSTAVSVTTPAIADTTPPTAPTGLTAKAVASNQINLTWAAATDNGGSGLAGYIVMRGTTEIGRTTATSFGDATLNASTTYSYTVLAYDGAGNKSPASAAASATTPAATTSGGTTLTIAPAADTWLKAASPSTGFGSATTMRVDADALENLMIRFNVSSINGRTVTSAKLYLYCTDASSDGGSFYQTASNWSETVPWNNAPPISGSAVAKLGSVHSGSWAVIDVTSIVNHDATYSFRAKSSTSDGAGYNTREASSNKPKLVITVK